MPALRKLVWRFRNWWWLVRRGVLTVGEPPVKSNLPKFRASPHINIVRSRRTGQVFVVEFARCADLQGALTPFGEPIEVPGEDFSVQLLSIASRALDAFEGREAVVGNVLGPQNQKLHRTRATEWASVSRPTQTSLCVRPLHRKANGAASGLPDEEVALSTSCAPEDFLRVLDLAWQESGVTLA